MVRAVVKRHCGPLNLLVPKPFALVYDAAVSSGGNVTMPRGSVVAAVVAAAGIQCVAWCAGAAAADAARPHGFYDPLYESSYAQSPRLHPAKDSNPSPRLVLVEENDWFAGNRDYGYTQGFRASLVFHVFSDRSIAAGGFELLGGIVLPSAPQLSVQRQFEWIMVGQSIFTPFLDDALIIPDRRDRLHAGWLYTGAAWMQQTGRTQLDNFEVLVGLVGPSAGGETVQKFVHPLLSKTKHTEWQRQLENEPAILLAWDRRWKFELKAGDGLEVDVIPSIGVSLGNVYTYAAAGALIRLGRSLASTWGPARVRPAPAGGSFFAPPEKSLSWGYAVFAGFETRAVARDIFLDGNTGQSGPPISRNVFVADLIAGVEWFNRSGSRIAFSVTKRTKTFAEELHPDLFGSIEASVRF